MLDYGDGLVLVEMDDGDRDADAYKLLDGDKLTVTGRSDDDFFESTKIEASGVFVENLNTTFFASAVDEESSDRLLATVTIPVFVSQTVIQGTVTDVDTNEFTVDAGLRDIRVDVTTMPYNPLGDEGYQKVDVGDRVKVQGEMTSTLIEGRQLEAEGHRAPVGRSIPGYRNPVRPDRTGEIVNEGRLVAGIELDDEGEKFTEPGCFGEEVSGRPERYNANPARRPFRAR